MLKKEKMQVTNVFRGQWKGGAQGDKEGISLG